MPRDGADNCERQGTKKTSIKELLDAVRYTDDVLLARGNLNTRNSGHKEHARHNTELYSNHHEAGQVLGSATEQEVSSFPRKNVGTAVGGTNLGNCKEGNLHGFKHADDTEEEEVDDNGSSRREAFPYTKVSFLGTTH